MYVVCATISHGIFALFGFSNETTRAAVDAFTRTFHMPYVTASAPVNDSLTGHADASTSTAAAHRSATRDGFTIYLRPLFDRAMLDLIRHYRWRNISYIYDSNDGKLILTVFFQYVLLLIVYRICLHYTCTLYGRIYRDKIIAPGTPFMFTQTLYSPNCCREGASVHVI